MQLWQVTFTVPPGGPLALRPALEDALRSRYTVERELGRGGMATVFLGRDLKHDRLVAIKVLHAELASSLGPDRFLREIKIAAGLSHPNILPLYDSGAWQSADGAPGLYYAMSFVEGESLRNRLSREGQLPLEDALRIARDVAAALSYAHEHGVIHRDVKPENILLAGYPPARGSSSDWRVFLADFGIAKAVDAAASDRLTETGLALGTPAYMSPEQASADGSVDQRSDLYALGCVLYEMVAGQPPFTGATARAVMARHALDSVPSLRVVRPTVPLALERTVTRLLAKVPADRFSSAADVRRALTDGKATLAVRLPSWRDRKLLAILGSAVVLAGVAFVLLRERQRAPPAALDPDVVAVLPFRTSGADSGLRYLREGIVDLLAIKLTGEGGPRAADPRAVLSAWRRAVGSSTRDPGADAAVEVARKLGAGRLITGAVTGTPRLITLTASVMQASNGRRTSHASVAGSADSLPALVDRLTAQLLAGEAGRTYLATLTTLPALQAYFYGQRAYRSGRWSDALEGYTEALQLDSTFALAGMGVVAAMLWTLDKYWPPGTDPPRAAHLAWQARDKLSARDQALLAAKLGPRYPEPSSYAEFIAAREQAIAAAPDRPESWYELGDEIYHFGALIGIPDARERAANAFRRSLALDSSGTMYASFAEPLLHLAQIAAGDGDTATVNRLVATALAADSTSEQSGELRWLRAAATGDRAALDSVRGRIPGMPAMSLINIVNESQELGLGWKEAQLVVEVLRARPAGAGPLGHVLALNRGRPKEAVDALDHMQGSLGERRRWRVVDALYWDGDTAEAGRAVRELQRFTAGRPSTSAERDEQYRDVCVTGQWRASRGDLAGVRAALARLPKLWREGGPAYCGSVLEVWLATLANEQDAASGLAQLDSLYLQDVSDAPSVPAGLLLARLHEAQHDPRGALAALRRRAVGFQPFFISTFMREEARLAAQVGDTGAAIKAYQRYLALRSDPEPALRPDVEQVRSELAALLAEPR